MLAMRPALYHRESGLPAEKSGTSAAPTGVAAMLLRSWMSPHG
jgi:hypothetical protein